MLDPRDPDSSPRILILAPRTIETPRDGGALRVAAVRAALVEAGYEVDMLTLEEVETAGTTRRKRHSLLASLLPGLRVALPMFIDGSAYVRRYFDFRLVRELLELRRRSGYLATVIEYSYLAPYRRVAPGAILIDLHNIESELKENFCRSLSRDSDRKLLREAATDARALRRIERHLARSGLPISTVSEHDRDIILDLARGTHETPAVCVAPNGAPELAFAFEGERSESVAFVAHLGWEPNVRAAVWLREQVWPYVRATVPSATLNIVGRTPTAEVRRLKDASQGVFVHGDVPDVLPFVGCAKVATAPLLAAGGTRLKILEALASGTPVVSTGLGALGLEHLRGESLMIVDDPSEFAEALIGCLRAPGPSRVVSRNLVDQYRWSNALRPLVHALNSTIGVTSPFVREA